MTDRVRFGIALYAPLVSGEGKHWALAVSDKNTLTGRLNVYQIVYARDSTHTHKKYELAHSIVEDHKGAVLQNSRRFYGVIDLGTVQCSYDHVCASIEEQPADQHHYPLPAGKEWSCAWWVIRALRELQKTHVNFPVTLPAHDLDLYNHVVVQLSEAIAASHTKTVTYH